MDAVKLKVYAKLNLSLFVTGLLPNGFHALDSIMQSVSICDTLTVKKRTDGRCAVRMCGGVRVRNNSAARAAELFVRTFGCGGADIVVEKGIPIAGGMGGSSANAAGALAGLALLYGIKLSDVEPLADAIGSDVKFMLRGGLARVGGRGGELEFVCAAAPPLWFVVLQPPFGLSTGAVYRQFDKSPDFCGDDGGGRLKNLGAVGIINDWLLKDLAAGNIKGVRDKMFNALQWSALEFSAAAQKFFKKISQTAPVMMTGSGSCFFAVCESQEESARLCAKFRDSGVTAYECTSVEKGIEVI